MQVHFDLACVVWVCVGGRHIGAAWRVGGGPAVGYDWSRVGEESPLVGTWSPAVGIGRGSTKKARLPNCMCLVTFRFGFL